MAMTVGELLAVPSVDTHLIAGELGLGRLISWAHVCELAEPWDWIGENELLLTTGLGVPQGLAAQAQYVERLAAVGASGIAIGDNMHAPPISAEMRAAADAASLPLLLTARDVPFMVISRLVAGASARENQHRLASTERIYGYMRTLATEESPEPLLAALGQELAHRLLLVEGGTVRDAEGSHSLDDDEASQALVEAARAAQAGDRGTVIRLRDDSRTLAIALPPPNPATLFAVPESGRHTDLGLIQHAAAVIAAQRATAGAGRERARRLGASLFARLVDGTIDSTVAVDELADRGLGQTRYLLAASATDETEEWANLHHHLDALGVGHLLLVRGGVTLAMVPAEEGSLEAVGRHLPPTGRVGVSEPFDKVSETRSATLQARWALHQGQRGGERLTHFAPSQTAVGFLPVSLADNERAARRVLGPLLAYDEDKRSHLVDSLRAFLEENRSWQRAAKRLHVHKQTLVYRIERVEQLTGRQLDSTADVAELWLAIQAAMACGMIDI
jgi:purine catabolism regulator